MLSKEKVFVVFDLLGAPGGQGEDRNKNSKSLRVKDFLFVLSLAFWGPQVGKEKGQTTKIANP